MRRWTTGRSRRWPTEMSNSSYLTEVNRVSGGCWPRSDGGGGIGQERGQLLRGHRTGQQEALNPFALEQAKGEELLLGLDALGGDRAPQRAGQADQRGHDGLVAGV